MAKRRNLIGSFVYRDEGDGCLTSKYVNNFTRAPFTEACKRFPDQEITEGFVGRFRTTWIEENRTIEAELRISRNERNTFDLIWSNQDGVIFEGIGMLFDDLLIGAYWE